MLVHIKSKSLRSGPIAGELDQLRIRAFRADNLGAALHTLRNTQARAPLNGKTQYSKKVLAIFAVCLQKRHSGDKEWQASMMASDQHAKKQAQRGIA